MSKITTKNLSASETQAMKTAAMKTLITKTPARRNAMKQGHGEANTREARFGEENPSRPPVTGI
jgi:hypothetical protein